MIHTIKLDANKAIRLQPDDAGGVRIEVLTHRIPVINHTLTPDQAGAVLFAMEQIAEQNSQKAGGAA